MDTGQRKDGGVGWSGESTGRFYNGKVHLFKTQSSQNPLLYRKERGGGWGRKLLGNKVTPIHDSLTGAEDQKGKGQRQD